MKRIDDKAIASLLTEFKEQYPEELHREAFAGQRRDIEQVKLLFVENGSLLDLGGGISTANLVLARLGMKVIVVDIFEQYWNAYFALHGASDGMNRIRKLFDQERVTLMDADILTFDYRDRLSGSMFDVVSSFNCFEHLHHSPKPMLENCLSLLRPGGKVVFGVPNSVNIYKRIKVLFGKTNHPQFDKFYYHGSPWYGHVREYSCGDWKMLAGFLNLKDIHIRGYNWNLFTSKKFPRVLVGPVDRMLRLFPSLCTDTCLIGRRELTHG
jgi:SAM-dependent methyltransferase